ncbi:ABC transporter permease, partial [Escherichia coli]
MLIDENNKQLTSTDFELKKDNMNQEFVNVKNKSFWQDAWTQLRKNRLAVIG